jgi:hypothetical protein
MYSKTLKKYINNIKNNISKNTRKQCIFKGGSPISKLLSDFYSLNLHFEREHIALLLNTNINTNFITALNLQSLDSKTRVGKKSNVKDASAFDGIPPEFASAMVTFVILTYKNEKYYRFINRYFHLNIKDIKQLTVQFIRNLSVEPINMRTFGGGNKKTYKMIIVTSICSMIYFYTNLYYSSRILLSHIKQNPIIKDGVTIGELMLEGCETGFHPKKDDTQFKRFLFHTVRNVGADSKIMQIMKQLENYKIINICLKDDLLGKTRDNIIKNAFNRKEYDIEKKISQKLLLSAPPIDIPAQNIQSHYASVIGETTGTITPTDSSPSSDSARTWIPKEDIQSNALVATTDNDDIASVNSIMTTSVEQHPDKFITAFDAIKTDIRDVKTSTELIAYFDRLSEIDEETFQRRFFKRDDLSMFDTFHNIIAKKENLKEYFNYFVSSDIFNKVVLYMSNVDISKIIFTEFKMAMRQLKYELERELKNTEKKIDDTIDITTLIVTEFNAIIYNIYKLFFTLVMFSIASYKVYLDSRKQLLRLT